VDDRLSTALSLRREWWQAKDAAWLPGWSARYRLLQISGHRHYLSLSLSGNVQRSYRVPQINELYFSPGGNPNLRPEQGWNEDGGLSVQLYLNKTPSAVHTYRWNIHHRTSLFNRNIKDWIYWLGGAIWTPHNL